MAKEKKASAGAVYSAVTAEVGLTAPDTKTPESAALSHDDPASGDANAARGHGHTVLPGILGKQLRAAYGELLNTPVPDRFNDLIEKLERQEAASKPSGEPQREEEGE